jgi:DNA repair protein RecN (Recombination protein N)
MYTRARPHPGGDRRRPPPGVDDTRQTRTRLRRLCAEMRKSAPKHAQGSCGRPIWTMVCSRRDTYHHAVLRRLRIENLVLIRAAELEFGPGLNAITGETGAGKTILAQAIGLLLGAKGDAGFIGADGDEAYVEAELDVPRDLYDEAALERLAELRPEDEDGLVLARRIFGDGRTRAYAWGRSAAREDVAAAAEGLIAMSGQFEQRRLARASYQLEVLDAFVGTEQQRRRAELRVAWRELLAAQRRDEEVRAGAAEASARLDELRALVEDTQGFEPDGEDLLRAERERLRHVTELAEAAAVAATALAPEEGEGAAGLAALAERAVAPVERLAPELQRAGDELRDVELRLRETATELRAFLTGLESEPGRLEEVEAALERIAETKRRFRVDSYAELLARAAEARSELDAIADGRDPVEAVAAALAAAEREVNRLSDELRAARTRAVKPFSDAVAAELHDVGLGEGEFVAELREHDASPTGIDEVAFMIRPNQGLPFAPVAETASGGELSRIALAIAAVAGGETMVFDEIDAGIGGETAHRVAETLRRLAQRAQVVTITHLPQIASVADRHFRVEKIPGDPTHTRIEPLGEDVRREELRRMLGGQEFLSRVGS